MRIWLMTVGEPLPRWSGGARLWRTGLLAQELVGRGHDVTWWTSSVDHFTKRYFVKGNEKHQLSERFAIQFLHGTRYTKNISVARLLNHFQIARGFERIAAAETPPDIVWCSLPTVELSKAAVDFGIRHGVPAVVDIRDLWPDEIARRFPGGLRYLAGAALAPMTRQVRMALRGAQGITAISRQYLDWALHHAGRGERPSDGVFPMGYPKDVSATSLADIGGRFVDMGVDPSRRIFWFAGNFVSSADLDTVIAAARRVADDVSVQIVLTGAGEDEARLRAQAAGLRNVIFTGWASKDELAWLAGIAWAGLVAYRKGALQSLPNKIFEYLSFGLPILVSLGGEARTLAEQEGVGLYYEAESPGDLATKMQALAAAPDLRSQQSARALQLITERFSASAVYRKLAEFLELAAKDARAVPPSSSEGR